MTLMKYNLKTRARQGFTLVELMVVILIIAILAAMIVPRLISRTDDAKEAAAVADLRNLSKMLDTYRLDTGTYPSQEEGLEALRSSNAAGWKGPYLQKPLEPDPWGNDYIYGYPGPDGDDSFYLYSKGKDGQDNTADDIIESGE